MERFWQKDHNIAILGGTFNPVHLGHIMMAKTVLKEIRELDRLVVLPNNLPAYKNTSDMIDVNHRLEMLKLAFYSMELKEYADRISISTLEIERGGVTYTIDTLNQIKACNENANIYFTIGADSLFSIRKWHCFEDVLKKCCLLVLARDCDKEMLEQTKQNIERDFSYAKIISLDNTQVNVSSSDIRKLIQEGRNTDDLLTKEVQEYISINHLYEVEKNES